MRTTWTPPTATPTATPTRPPDPPPPTLRPGWTMPAPPPGGPWEPYCYIVGGDDGCVLYWIPAGCEDPGADTEYTDETSIPWPFGDDDIARIADFEALGFRVES